MFVCEPLSPRSVVGDLNHTEVNLRGIHISRSGRFAAVLARDNAIINGYNAITSCENDPRRGDISFSEEKKVISQCCATIRVELFLNSLYCAQADGRVSRSFRSGRKSTSFPRYVFPGGYSDTGISGTGRNPLIYFAVWMCTRNAKNKNNLSKWFLRVKTSNVKQPEDDISEQMDTEWIFCRDPTIYSEGFKLIWFLFLFFYRRLRVFKCVFQTQFSHF